MKKMFFLSLIVSVIFAGNLSADVMRNNEAINAYRMSEINDLSVSKMHDGVVDVFVDESGVDTTSDYATITDESYTKSHQVGIYGDAAVTKDDKKWGDASVYFDGSGDYLLLDDSTDFDMAGSTTDTWTLDVWLYPSSAYSTIYSHAENNGIKHVALYYHYVQKRVTFWVYNSSYVVNLQNADFDTVPFNTWSHIAVVKVGSNWALYVNGVRVDHNTQNGTVTVSGYLNIGRSNYTSDYLKGNIDELRLQKSNPFNADPTSSDNITVPTGSYVADSDTKLLLHFDSTTNDGFSRYFSPERGDDLTIGSEVFAAESEPTKAKLVIFEEDIDSSITLNTDIKAYVTKENGSWDELTLTDEGEYEDGKRILVGTDTSLTDTGTDKDMQYKIETNGVDLRIHGVGFSWE